MQQPEQKFYKKAHLTWPPTLKFLLENYIMQLLKQDKI